MPTLRAAPSRLHARALGLWSVALDDADPDHLHRLSALSQAMRLTTPILDVEVAACRALGHTWEEIGASLGITRQGTQQRFGRSHDQEHDDEA